MLAVTMTTWNMRGKAEDQEYFLLANIGAVGTSVLDVDTEVVGVESFCFHCLSLSLIYNSSLQLPKKFTSIATAIPAVCHIGSCGTAIGPAELFWLSNLLSQCGLRYKLSSLQSAAVSPT